MGRKRSPGLRNRNWDLAHREAGARSGALLKIPAPGNRQIEENRMTSVKSALKRIREQRETQG